MAEWLNHLASRVQEDDVDDDNEDFYGYEANDDGDARPGAMDGHREMPMPLGMTETLDAKPAPAEQANIDRKIENQRKAEALRAKLIAQRQNTPRQSTPVKAASAVDTPSKAPVALQQSTGKVTDGEEPELVAPSSDAYGIESLLAEGRAAAEAKKNHSRQETAVNTLHNETSVQTGALKVTESVASPTDIKQSEQHPSPAVHGLTTTDNSNKYPTTLSDSYYSDLPAWLEMSGYHDVAFRNAKLRTFKERRALEKEAASIARRLAALAEAERDNIAQLRASTAHPAGAGHDALPLPAIMPSEDAAVMSAVADRITNGVKRQRSSQPVPKSNKRREPPTGGFKIRGATNDSPDVRLTNRPSPPSLNRRVSHPGGRQMSGDGPPSRDPSLERRQAYYRRDPDADGGYRREDPGPRYAQYPSHDMYDTTRPMAQRPSYGSVGRGGGHRDFGSGHRGNAGLDLRKGGVRYFMIKSWNHDNVLQSMRDSLWATQTKNEELLTEAYRTSRHVILLFSVNKSMAFQGYAVMTSPPDPQLPKPSFCTKLNWSTSPAFTLRWLATTPVHFRMVGHLKNTCNVDDVTGEPRAVLVGKDGQEVSSDAGLGVATILDEAEAMEHQTQRVASR